MDYLYKSPIFQADNSCNSPLQLVTYFHTTVHFFYDMQLILHKIRRTLSTPPSYMTELFIALIYTCSNHGHDQGRVLHPR